MSDNFNNPDLYGPPLHPMNFPEHRDRGGRVLAEAVGRCRALLYRSVPGYPGTGALRDPARSSGESVLRVAELCITYNFHDISMSKCGCQPETPCTRHRIAGVDPVG